MIHAGILINNGLLWIKSNSSSTLDVSGRRNTEFGISMIWDLIFVICVTLRKSLIFLGLEFSSKN